MSLYVGDVDVALPFVFTTTTVVGTDVATVKVRATTNEGSLEWTMTPTATTATSVSCRRVLAAGDLPHPGRYPMRAWFYDALAVELGRSEEFSGPEIKPSRVSAPA